MASRSDQLKAMMSQMPVANEAAAQRARDTQSVMLRGAGALQAGAAPGAAQALGQQAAQQRAQTGLQTQARNVQQAGQLGQAALGEQQLQQQELLNTQQAAARDVEQDLRNQLAALNNEAANEELESVLEFNHYVANKEFLNTQALADYAVAKGMSDVELRQAQAAQQRAHQRLLQMNEYAQQILDKEVKQKSEKELREQYQMGKSQLQGIQEQLQKRQQKIQRESATQQAKWQAVGAISGAAAKAFTGGLG